MDSMLFVISMVALYAFIGIGFAKFTGNFLDECSKRGFRLFLMVSVGLVWMPLMLIGACVLLLPIARCRR